VKFLAVADHGQSVWLEEAQEVRRVLAMGIKEIKFYPVQIHGDTYQPVIGDAITLEELEQMRH